MRSIVSTTLLSGDAGYVKHLLEKQASLAGAPKWVFDPKIRSSLASIRNKNLAKPGSAMSELSDLHGSIMNKYYLKNSGSKAVISSSGTGSGSLNIGSGYHAYTQAGSGIKHPEVYRKSAPKGSMATSVKLMNVLAGKGGVSHAEISGNPIWGQKRFRMKDTNKSQSWHKDPRRDAHNMLERGGDSKYFKRLDTKQPVSSESSKAAANYFKSIENGNESLGRSNMIRMEKRTLSKYPIKEVANDSFDSELGGLREAALAYPSLVQKSKAFPKSKKLGN